MVKLAFRLQDYDDDGLISKSDMNKYVVTISGNILDITEVTNIVDTIFQECSSDSAQEVISFSDFQRVIAGTDFYTKLYLPI